MEKKQEQEVREMIDKLKRKNLEMQKGIFIEDLEFNKEMMIFNKKNFLLNPEIKLIMKEYLKLLNKEMVKNKINIYPNYELMKKLKEETQEQKRSMNNLIILILDSYFSKRTKKAEER